MAIVRWEPFRNLVSTQDQFNRLFNETFSRLLGNEATAGAARNWAPAVDVLETDHDFVLKAELPGVNPDAVEIRVEDNTLYLKGERKLDADQKNYHQIERAYGTFTRSFTLPTSIDADKVAANYKDGLLTLTIPKREEAKPKTIKIQVGQEPKTLGASVR
jgi:HSP20 family protein